MSGDKENKATFSGFKKLALGILLTVVANAIFLTISFTVREFPVCAGELLLSKGILQVRVVLATAAIGLIYRVFHQLADLGWVDFDIGKLLCCLPDSA